MIDERPVRLPEIKVLENKMKAVAAVNSAPVPLFVIDDLRDLNARSARAAD